MAIGQTNAKTKVIDVDAALSASSTNPVQNCAINTNTLVELAVDASPQADNCFAFSSEENPTGARIDFSGLIDAVAGIRTGSVSLGSSVPLSPVPRLVLVTCMGDYYSASGSSMIQGTTVAMLTPGTTSTFGCYYKSGGTGSQDLIVSLSEDGLLSYDNGVDDLPFAYTALF